MSNVEQLIDKLTDAVSYKFKDDGTSPGLVISKLRQGYYCSVVRYPNGGASDKRNKVIVCKATASTLDLAVKEVAKRFVEVVKTQPTNPLEALGEAVRGI